MPVQRGTTTRDGERVGFYRWGEEGKMYTYDLGDEEERKEAKRKAAQQGRAIQASQ